MINCFSCVVAILSISFIDVQCELYTSIKEMEHILSVEKDLITHFSQFILSQENKFNYFQSYYDEITVKNNKSVADVRANNKTRTKLNEFEITKRMAWADWSNVVPFYMLLKEDVKEFVEQLQHHQSIFHYPSEEDLKGTVQALIRLQTTYKLNTSDLANGFIKNLQSPKLSADDCFVIGHLAEINQDYYYSGLWLETALVRLQTETTSNTTELELAILRNLVKSYEYQRSFQSAAQITEKILKIVPNDEVALKDKGDFELEVSKGKPSLTKVKELDDQIAEKKVREYENPIDYVENTISEMSKYEEILYQSVCRGDVTPSPKRLAHLKCRYLNKSAFLKIAPLKVEEMSLDPYIAVYHDVIYDSEIEVIKNISTPELQRAEVGEPPYQISNERISKSAFIEDKEHKYVADITKRVGDMTGLSMKSAENLQIVNYGVGGYYNLHFDFGPNNEKSFEDFGFGNRIATVLFYMSDVALGGATAFPLVKTAVFPKKGSAVFWWNLHKTGEIDVRTKHAGCPVLVGNKWVSNKWIHHVEQEFTRPCGIYPDHDLERVFK